MRVLSYNIHHGVGADGRLDLERTARAIARSGPELVGLQEVDRHYSARSGFVDQAAWLGERLGMHVAFGPALDRSPPSPGAPRRQYGNAVLAGPEIMGWRNLLLPRPEGGEQRALLEALVIVDGRQLRFLTTHLQNGSATERLAQVAAIRDVLAGLPPPVVLVGDLNAQPGAAEVRRLTAVLDDAWVTAGRGRGATYHAAAPTRRIDYVLTTPDLVATAARVPASRASDHRPVQADLESAGPEDGG